MDFDSDIRLDFLAHHNSSKRKDNTMFSPDILMYMCKALLKEEEEEWRMEATAKEKLLEIFKGNPSEAEHFIYEFAAYFMAHDKEPVLPSPVARAALTLSQVKGEEVDQWVDQQLQWLELQDQQDLKVGSTFIEAFFEQFVPKGRWQNIARIEMKWPYIDKYISNFKKAHVHSRQPLKGIYWVQQFIEGLAGSVKRAMMDKFQTYEKAKKQTSHIVGIQKLPLSSLQEKEWHVDKCARTTTKHAPTYNAQETHESYAVPQRTEKDKESTTNASERSRKKGRNRSTPIHGKS